MSLQQDISTTFLSAMMDRMNLSWMEAMSLMRAE